MNRTIYSLKQIKLNPFTNKVSSNFSKQKWNISNAKTKTNNFQNIIKRRYSSDNSSPQPPNPMKNLIIIACTLGMVDTYIRINNPEKNE